MYIGSTIMHFIAGITDFAISVFALWAFFQILYTKNSAVNRRFFLLHFLLLSLSTLIGGLAGHIYLNQLADEWKLPGWVISMVAITFLERAVITQSSKVLANKWLKPLLAFNLIELCFFTYLTITTLNFKFVEYHAAYGLLVVVLGLGIIQWKQGHFRKNLFLGVLFSVASAVLFQLKFNITIWFNFMGISHLLLVLSAYFFYRLAKE